MNENNIAQDEFEFFCEGNINKIHSLLPVYYDQGKYSLVWYLASGLVSYFEDTLFYKMISLVNMGYYKKAEKVYQRHINDWFDIMNQYNIYWKHRMLFIVYFHDFDFSDSFKVILDEYHEDDLAEFIELFYENPTVDIWQLPVFKRLVIQYPELRDIWEKNINLDGPQLLSFENVQWKVWNAYNDMISKLNYGIPNVKCIYSQDIHIYSYKPNEVAASMHILTDGQTTIILDCGCEICEEGILKIPITEILATLHIRKVDAVCISHAHMDHYGSINEIKDFPIFMTLETQQTIKLMSPELLLKQTKIVVEYNSIDVDDVIISFIPNGHICGSVLLDINWKKIKRIIYTGDFTLENQKTVSGLDLKDIKILPRVNILLTESTYGNRKYMLPLKYYENIFISICQKLLFQGKKIIIPTFAVGRAQEVALLLAPMVKKSGYRILIDGLAAKITEYYQLNKGIPLLSANISVNTFDLELHENLINYDIILASSGMLQTDSTSYKYIQSVLRNNKFAIVKVGFIHPYEHMLISILNHKANYCDFSDIPLSAHADFVSLVRLAEYISPDYAIYVHGPGIKNTE